VCIGHFTKSTNGPSKVVHLYPQFTASNRIAPFLLSTNINIMRVLISFFLATLLHQPSLVGAVTYEVAVWFTNTAAAPDAIDVTTMDAVSQSMEASLDDVYSGLKLKVPASWSKISSTPVVRFLRAGGGLEENEAAQDDRELAYTCGCKCLCAAGSYLCKAYCPGFPRRLTAEVTSAAGEDDALTISKEDDRELAAIVGDALKVGLIGKCNAMLNKAAKNSSSKGLAGVLMGSKCFAAVSIV
jgi:hypothetical protein